MPVSPITVRIKATRAAAGTSLALGAGMRRITVVVLVAGVTGWVTPSAAQKALHVSAAPNALLGSRASHLPRANAPVVDQRALRVTAAATPSRVSLSTGYVSRLPARASWTPSHTALAGAFTISLLIDAAQTRALARQGLSLVRLTGFTTAANVYAPGAIRTLTGMVLSHVPLPCWDTEACF